MRYAINIHTLTSRTLHAFKVPTFFNGQSFFIPHLLPLQLFVAGDSRLLRFSGAGEVLAQPENQCFIRVLSSFRLS